MTGGSAAVPLRMRSSLGRPGCGVVCVSFPMVNTSPGRRHGEHTSGSSNQNMRKAAFFDVGVAGHEQVRLVLLSGGIAGKFQITGCAQKLSHFKINHPFPFCFLSGLFGPFSYNK